MGLPASGQISISDLNIEMGLSPTGSLSLDYAASQLILGHVWGSQVSISDFYATPYPQLLAYSTYSIGSCTSPVFTYYTDGVVIDTSTGIYVNTTLTTLALTGYYNDNGRIFYWNKETQQLIQSGICTSGG